MKNNEKLKKWLPCTDYCQMSGAASAFLSINDGHVLMNSPRWCAIVSEMELAAAVREFEQRLFCSEIGETELLYGAEENITNALDEIKTTTNPSFLGLISSCAMSLIGDDIKGICKNSDVLVPLVNVESGGLKGEFWQGYKDAMIAILKTLDMKTSDNIQKNTVNIIGISTCYPNWQGDLNEIKRLLGLVNINVNVVLGENNLSLEKMKKIPKAILNIVVARELGDEIAYWLKENIKQDYIIAEAPYGVSGTLKWLDEINNALNNPFSMSAVQKEIKVVQTDIKDEYFALKSISANMKIKRLIIAAPYSKAKNLAQGVLEDFKEINDAYIRVQGPDFEDKLNRFMYSGEFDVLPSDTYQVLCSSERERSEFASPDKTIYINFSMPGSRIKTPWETYVGISGWSYFMKNIFNQLNTLFYQKQE